MSAEVDIVSLFEKVCYRGLDIEKIAKQIVNAWGKDLDQNALRAAVAWVAAGANVARLAESAKMGKVQDANAATTLSSTVAASLGSVKMTHWAKAFSPVILYVRFKLAKAGKITDAEVWADTAFLGFHASAFQASVDLTMSIADSKQPPVPIRPADAEASARRYANIANEKSPKALKSFFTSMTAGTVSNLTLQMAMDVVRDMASTKSSAQLEPVGESAEAQSTGILGRAFGRGKGEKKEERDKEEPKSPNKEK